MAFTTCNRREQGRWVGGRWVEWVASPQPLIARVISWPRGLAAAEGKSKNGGGRPNACKCN